MRKFIKYVSKIILGCLTLLFEICVLFLELLGKVFGLTYKQISVVFNLWIQGAVLTLSGLLPLLAIIIFQMKWFDFQDYGLYLIIFALYGYGYIYAFIKMLCHYHLPFDFAFDLCVEDLQWLAKKWHTTYMIVNLLIFIVFFLILLVLNLYISTGFIPIF